jgi:hypothetical protein
LPCDGVEDNRLTGGKVKMGAIVRECAAVL